MLESSAGEKLVNPWKHMDGNIYYNWTPTVWIHNITVLDSPCGNEGASTSLCGSVIKLEDMK